MTKHWKEKAEKQYREMYIANETYNANRLGDSHEQIRDSHEQIN